MGKTVQVKYGDTVKVHYDVKVEDSIVFDSPTYSEHLKFTIGEMEVLSGFQRAIVGMWPSESKTVKVPANQAFGSRRKGLVFEINHKLFPSDSKPKIGQYAELVGEDGQSTLCIVTSISRSKVILDANHPLAGKDLIFKIQLLEIITKLNL